LLNIPVKYRVLVTDIVVPSFEALESKRGRGDRLDFVDVVCAIIYVLHEGVRWRALPAVFGNWKSIYTRMSRWSQRGALGAIFEVVSTDNQRGKLRHLDASHIKVHQDANVADPAAQAMGKTRGGRNTKLHAVVDSAGHAVRLKLTPGQDHDSKHALEMSDGLTPGQTLVADKAYDVDAIRAAVAGRGTGVCIPAKSNRKHPATHHKGYYKKRHEVENFFQRAKRCRRIGTRYEKTERMFMAFVTLFAIIDYYLH
jgi:transposase